jgi:hypothetical protein
MRRYSPLILTPIMPAIIIHLPMPGAADAYLDPGTGSVILQMAIAGVVGGLFAVKLFWGRIGSFFRNLLSPSAKR